MKTINDIGYPLYECLFKQGKNSQNGSLAPDKILESGVVKIQRGKSGRVKGYIETCS